MARRGFGPRAVCRAHPITPRTQRAMASSPGAPRPVPPQVCRPQTQTAWVLQRRSLRRAPQGQGPHVPHSSIPPVWPAFLVLLVTFS